MALGHAELIEQAATDQVADDAHVVVSELGLLRKQACCMLLLASAGDPGFLDLAPVALDTLVMDALERWGYTPRRWRLGEVTEASVTGDHDRLAAALDALLENAVAHTAPEDLIELGVRLVDGQAVFAVTDLGCGIPGDDLERIFDRFSRWSSLPQPGGLRASDWACRPSGPSPKRTRARSGSAAPSAPGLRSSWWCPRPGRLRTARSHQRSVREKALYPERTVATPKLTTTSRGSGCRPTVGTPGPSSLTPAEPGPVPPVSGTGQPVTLPAGPGAAAPPQSGRRRC